MPDPLVSIVVPCHNGGAYIERCVRSVMDQNISAEVILVDDGSTDDSLIRAREVMKSFPEQMLVITQANQGLAATRNRGIRAAAGKYIGFLDVDDEYVSGFLPAAAKLLDQRESVVAVQGAIEFLGIQRPIEPWQRDAMESTSACDILLRAEIVRQIGGFPVNRAFRGEVGGEDGSFRVQLARFGDIVKIAHPAIRYHVRPGSHVDLFLDRAVLEEGKLRFKHALPEETDGSFHSALARYHEQVAARMRTRVAEILRLEITSVANFEAYCRAFAHMPGDLGSSEEFAIYCLAKRWPLVGPVVEIGGWGPRSACWLAAACKASGTGRVTVIEPSRASSQNGPEAASRINQCLQRVGLAAMVDVIEGSASSVRSRWNEPIRLLLLSPAPPESVKQDLESWSPILTVHGLLAIVGDAGSAADFLREYFTQHSAQWRQLLQLPRTIVFEKLG